MKRLIIMILTMIPTIMPLYVYADSTACCNFVGTNIALESLKAGKVAANGGMTAIEQVVKTTADLEGKVHVLQGLETGVVEAVNFAAKGAAEVLSKINIRSVKGELKPKNVAEGKLPTIQIDTGAFGMITLDVDLKDPANMVAKIAEELANRLVDLFKK